MDWDPAPGLIYPTHCPYSCRLSLFPELLNHDINTLLLHMQAHIVVIDEHDGGIPTRAHALGLSQGNQTVLGCLPIVNTQLFLEILTSTHPIQIGRASCREQM